MRIATLRLFNFLCFRGEHRLDLEARVYAVVARLVGDPERSNWLGKSALLEAVDFAIYGRHRKRTDDEWITTGEPNGEVEIIFDTGDRILRSRHRGKATKVYFFRGREQAMQGEAQKLIDEFLGLSSEDFLNTCYFAQKSLSRFIVAKPADRMAIISEWLRLGPLEACEARVSSEVAKLVTKLGEIDNFIATLNSRLLPQGAHRSEMEVLSSRVTTRRGELARCQDEIEANAKLIAAQNKVKDFESLSEEGFALRALVDSKGDRTALQVRAAQLQSEVGAIASDVETAVKKTLERTRLVGGDFDGRCPVMLAPCPVSQTVGEVCHASKNLLSEAKLFEAAERKRLELAETRAVEASSKSREVERLSSKLDLLREQAERMIDDVEIARELPEPRAAPLLRARFDQIQGLLQTDVAALAQLTRAIDEQGAIQSQLTHALSERLAVATTADLWREALVIFGKQGAQKKVAEQSLFAIEEGANTTLEGCGVDLRVGVRWSREGSGLAKTCDHCGFPFSSSAKVRVCSSCQAPRRPLLVNKLELTLSDRSGAAEDLAGAAIQLAASAWLREDRGCAWSVALLDEPFGALDRAHRRAFGSHLVSMLGAYGFDQAFVVAHHADVLDALPGRIEIVSENGASIVRVIA